MTNISALSRFVSRNDPTYDHLVATHRAHTQKARLFYLALHLIPGIGAYIGLFYLREPLIAMTGWSNRTAQIAMLLVMALGWHLLVPFGILRWVDRLTFSESLIFLGLHRLDWKGLLTVVPLATAIFTLISIPYMAFIHPPLFQLLNSLPFITMQEWHIYNIGYYELAWPLLVVVFVANFLGEELYFRGFLLPKISGIKGDWMISNLLFELYHVWQAPLNWAFAPAFAILPFSLLVKWRKNIYGTIVFHVYVNLIWGELLFLMLGS